jgi:methylated-DNA-[protein]-cysteine S-methyltransferase
MRYYDTLNTPHGAMLVAATDRGLSGVWFKGQKYFPATQGWTRDAQHAVVRRAKKELTEFFAGKRRRFSVALDPEGTPFQRKVWQAIYGVGFGERITYGELARRAGVAGSARAAGAATGRNPICVVVPCHRIVGANGALTGYAGGLGRKRALLALEGATQVTI